VSKTLAGVNVGSPRLFWSHADSQISASRSSRRVLCARCAIRSRAS